MELRQRRPISVKESIEIRKAKILHIQSDIRKLEYFSGYYLVPSLSPYLDLELITKKYSEAEIVELIRIERESSLEHTLHFYAKAWVPWLSPDIIIHCEHDNWFQDVMRFAQIQDKAGKVQRHDISKLVGYYQSLGVRPKVLGDLKNLVTKLYQEPTTGEIILFEK